MEKFKQSQQVCYPFFAFIWLYFINIYSCHQTQKAKEEAAKKQQQQQKKK